MEFDALFTAEYGFLLKMIGLACLVIVAGILIRKGTPHSTSEAD